MGLGVINEKPRNIKEPSKPGDDKNDVEGLEVKIIHEASYLISTT
ncbi:MAG: hypothetical protein Fur0010_21800 [Bdellovibrio sp.]